MTDHGIKFSLKLKFLQKSDRFNQQDIANLTNMDRMHISQIVSYLEKKGFIEKKVNPQDLRTNSISITDDGKHQLSLAMPIVEKFDKYFFPNES